jgi:hypothetical protein
MRSKYEVWTNNKMWFRTGEANKKELHQEGFKWINRCGYCGGHGRIATMARSFLRTPRLYKQAATHSTCQACCIGISQVLPRNPEISMRAYARQKFMIQCNLFTSKRRHACIRGVLDNTSECVFTEPNLWLDRWTQMLARWKHMLCSRDRNEAGTETRRIDSGRMLWKSPPFCSDLFPLLKMCFSFQCSLWEEL